MDIICNRCHKKIPKGENYLTYNIQYSYYTTYDEYPTSQPAERILLCQSCIEKRYYLSPKVKFKKIKKNISKTLRNIKKKNNF